ncbi:MAG: ABC-type transport auxiliary lipoprotein family protein [Gammaproteobacteria bacterium]
MIKIMIAITLMLALLTACSIAPKDKQTVSTYDFGLPNQILADNRTRLTIRPDIPSVSSPTWLDTPAILYRLAYQDSARLQPYADSRWAASPAALLTLRLRQAIAAVTPDSGAPKQHELQVALEEFSQIFDAPGISRVLLRASVKLLSEDGRDILAERTFAIERPSPTGDANGAVKALTQASDEFITQVANWLKDLPNI